MKDGKLAACHTDHDRQLFVGKTLSIEQSISSDDNLCDVPQAGQLVGQGIHRALVVTPTGRSLNKYLNFT